MPSDPYIRFKPYDIITSGDWNNLQSSMREHIVSHAHTGDDDGVTILGEGIEDKALDETKIDPASSLTVRELTVGSRKVVEEIEALTRDKVSRAGDTISGPLKVQNLTVEDVITARGLTVGDPGQLLNPTAVPPSHVYLHGPADSDAWIYRDTSRTSSNRGIYHHRGEDPVGGLPGETIGFVGDDSRLQASVSLADGSGYFAGNLKLRSGIFGANTQPLKEQRIFPRTLFGHQPPGDDSSYSVNHQRFLGRMCDVFWLGFVGAPPGFTRKFRLYIIYGNTNTPLGPGRNEIVVEYFTKISHPPESYSVSYPFLGSFMSAYPHQREDFTDWHEIDKARPFARYTDMYIRCTGDSPSTSASLCYAEIQFRDFYP